MALTVTTGEGLALTTRSENIKSEGGIGFKHQEVIFTLHSVASVDKQKHYKPKRRTGKDGKLGADSPRLSLTSRRREIGRKLEELGSREKDDEEMCIFPPSVGT